MLSARRCVVMRCACPRCRCGDGKRAHALRRHALSMIRFSHKLLVLPTAVLRDTHRALAQAEPEVAAVVLGDDDAALQELLKEAYAVSISWHSSPTCISVSQVTRWPAHVCAQLPKVSDQLFALVRSARYPRTIQRKPSNMGRRRRSEPSGQTSGWRSARLMRSAHLLQFPGDYTDTMLVYNLTGPEALIGT